MFRSKVIAVVLSLVSFSTEAANYLDGSQLVAAHGSNVYQYVTTPVDWDSALVSAASYSWNGVSGHLVTISSLEENNFLFDAFIGPRFAASTDSLAREQAVAWIALSDRNTEGVWRWMAGPEVGEVAAFVNWNGGEPNDCCGGEDYAVLHWQDRGLGTGKWYDYSPLVYGGQTYIVEFENALVPIPAAAWLFGGALGLLGVVRRRSVV